MRQGTGPEAGETPSVMAERGMGLGTGPWQLCGGGAVVTSVPQARGLPWCLWIAEQEQNASGHLSWASS